MLSRHLVAALCLYGLFSFACTPSYSQGIEDEIVDLEERVTKLERKLRGQEKKEKAQGETDVLTGVDRVFDDLNVEAAVTFVIQGVNNANGDNVSGGDKWISDASYSVDLQFEKGFDDFATAFLHLETGDGSGVEDELSLFSNVNRDADDSDNAVSVTEAWCEYYLQTLPLTLTLGKIDPTCYLDTNDYANDECTQFLGRMFRNSPVIEFPDDNAAGVRLLLKPVNSVDIEFQTLEADADWEDVFDDLFFSCQLNIKSDFSGRTGNYRLYGWLNGKAHTKWTDNSKTNEKGYGAGVSCDQKLSDTVGIFARYGWQDADVFISGENFSLNHAWSMGLQMAGSLWKRDNDIFAVVFGQVIPSDKYKDANKIKAESEKHVEAYYSLKVKDHFTFSPDIQIIWDPFGGDAANGKDTIVVWGMRVQIDF